MTPAELDLQARFVCQSSLKAVWDDKYGLSEEDVLGAAVRAEPIFNDLPDQIDRALTIAFDERDKLYQERMSI